MAAGPGLCIGLLACAWVFWSIPDAAAEEPGKYLGPTALVASEDGATLYVANADARQVMWVDLAAERVTRRVELPAEPTDLVLAPGGSRLFVAASGPKGQVLVIDAASGEMIAMIPTGHTCAALAVAPDGKRLYACNRFDNDVSVIDPAAGRELRRVKAVREPVAAAVTPDGSLVLVANHLPNTRTDTFFMGTVASVVTLIDARTHETAALSLPVGSHSLRDVCVSADGAYAYVTHLLCNFELTPTQVDMGWMHSNVVSVIDIRRRKLVNTVGLDELFVGAGNPWGVALVDGGKWIGVSHFGSHELSLVDAATIGGKLFQMFTSPYVGAIPYNPKKGADRQRRIRLPGKGPRGLAVVGSKAYVAEYFSDTVAVVDLAAADPHPRTIRLGPEPRPSLERQGQMLFCDATVCFQSWQSCESCHPDGRTDGINWDLMNDGVGNFKSTKSLLGAYETAPMMAEGVRPHAEAAVRAGLVHILFADRPEEEAAAIDAYLKSLAPVPSPRRVDGRLSPAAKRGRKLFESDRVGCFRCHPASLYTDGKMHDVGSRSRYGYTDRFDTPSLVEVWRTAPYLHDGRYLTIETLITKGKHGNVDGLTNSEIGDLVEFVLSL